MKVHQSVLCTVPGRHGDILWALPTVRAIAEELGAPVDLQIGQEYSRLVPLLEAQPYLRDVKAREGWVGDRADLREGWQVPAVGGYSRIINLGYRQWPTQPLPFEIADIARADVELQPLDLTRPWITVPSQPDRAWFWQKSGNRAIAVGFTDEHFELKYGLVELLDQQDHHWDFQVVSGGGRWLDEGGKGGCSWLEAADCISQAEVFVGCCSALHVLAVAMGKPCVVMEPHPARWQSIFWPLGQDGPQVTLVRGLDGCATFDARHTADTLRKVLEAQCA